MTPLLCEHPAGLHDDNQQPPAVAVVSDSSGAMKTMRCCRHCTRAYALNAADLAVAAFKVDERPRAVAITISPLPSLETP